MKALASLLLALLACLGLTSCAYTEAPTKAYIQAPKEVATQPITEAPTDLPTEAAIEASSEAPTEAYIEPAIEAPTEAYIEVPQPTALPQKPTASVIPEASTATPETTTASPEKPAATVPAEPQPHATVPQPPAPEVPSIPPYTDACSEFEARAEDGSCVPLTFWDTEPIIPPHAEPNPETPELDCENLKLGDAYAGIGLACNKDLQTPKP